MNKLNKILLAFVILGPITVNFLWFADSSDSKLKTRVETNTWKPDLFSWKTSPVDLSYLNHKPAGKYGRVKKLKDNFVLANGQPIKFWGVNLQASAIFLTTSENIELQAKRMAKLGINLVRIHHHDSYWVSPNIFEDNDSTSKLKTSSLKKIDQWITALNIEGIYVWLDLHVQRKLKKGDNIFAYDEIDGEMKGFSYVNESILNKMKAFQSSYLSHKNTLTAVKYKDNPGIMGLLLTNENNITNQGGNRLTSKDNYPQHNKLFEIELVKFVKAYGLDKNKVAETWLPGESKLLLNDLEHRFNLELLAALEQDDNKILLATTNLWTGGAYSLPALTDGDFIDSHAYVDNDELRINPHHQASFLTKIALAAVAGKPVTISEWNVGYDGIVNRYYLPLYLGAISSLQGWDAALLYGYGQYGLNRSKKLRNWSSFNDPAIMGIMPAAALMFRNEHVSMANKTYQLQLSPEQLIYQDYQGSTSKTLRTLVEQHRITIGLPKVKQLPWLKETLITTDSIVVSDANQDYLEPEISFVESDTKELRRNWSKGIFSVNTNQTQAVTGRIGGESIHLKTVHFNIETLNALVSVQSLDEKPILTTTEIFITVMAEVNSNSEDKRLVWSEPVVGEIQIQSASGKQLHSLDAKGNLSAPIEILYQKGFYIIKLDNSMPSHWYLLR